MSNEKLKSKSKYKLAYILIPIILALLIGLIIGINYCKNIAGTAAGIGNPIVDTFTNWGVITPYDILENAKSENYVTLPEHHTNIAVNLENNYDLSDEYVMLCAYNEMLLLDESIPSTEGAITYYSGVTVTLSTESVENTFTRLYIPFAYFGDEIRDSFIGKTVGDTYDVSVKLPDGSYNNVHVVIEDATVDLSDYLTDNWVKDKTPEEYGTTVTEYIDKVTESLEQENMYYLSADVCNTYISELFSSTDDVVVANTLESLYVDMINNSGVIVTDDVTGLADIYIKEDMLYLALYTNHCAVPESEFIETFNYVKSSINDDTRSTYNLTMLTVRYIVDNWIMNNIDFKYN